MRFFCVLHRHETWHAAIMTCCVGLHVPGVVSVVDVASVVKKGQHRVAWSVPVGFPLLFSDSAPVASQELPIGACIWRANAARLCSFPHVCAKQAPSPWSWQRSMPRCLSWQLAPLMEPWLCGGSDQRRRTQLTLACTWLLGWPLVGDQHRCHAADRVRVCVCACSGGVLLLLQRE